MNHTPGPWKSANVAPNNRPDKWIVAAVAGGDIAWLPFNLATGELREANARLIAAAPELLEALKIALEFFINPGKFNPVEVERIYEAAIAKAEGRDATK